MSASVNIYQKTIDYRDEWANGYHVMLDTEEVMDGAFVPGEDHPDLDLVGEEIDVFTPSNSSLA